MGNQERQRRVRQCKTCGESLENADAADLRSFLVEHICTLEPTTLPSPLDVFDVHKEVVDEGSA